MEFWQCGWRWRTGSVGDHGGKDTGLGDKALWWRCFRLLRPLPLHNRDYGRSYFADHSGYQVVNTAIWECIASAFLISSLFYLLRGPACCCAMALAKRPFQANHASTDDDPLEKVLQPPPDESPAERARREQEQREAQRVSLEIDEGIQEAKKLYDRRKKAVKILLLGE